MVIAIVLFIPWACWRSASHSLSVAHHGGIYLRLHCPRSGSGWCDHVVFQLGWCRPPGAAKPWCCCCACRLASSPGRPRPPAIRAHLALLSFRCCGGHAPGPGPSADYVHLARRKPRPRASSACTCSRTSSFRSSPDRPRFGRDRFAMSPTRSRCPDRSCSSIHHLLDRPASSPTAGERTIFRHHFLVYLLYSSSPRVQPGRRARRTGWPLPRPRRSLASARAGIESPWRRFAASLRRPMAMWVSAALLLFATPCAPPSSRPDPYDVAALDLLDSNCRPVKVLDDRETYWLGTINHGVDMLSGIFYGCGFP